MVVEPTVAVARVDVDDVQGFCVLNDEVGAVLEANCASESRLDLLRHAEVVEDGDVALVELDD